MSESDVERKRIADLEAKVLEQQQKLVDAEKSASDAKASEARVSERLKSFDDENRAAVQADAPRVQEFLSSLGSDDGAQPYQNHVKHMQTWATNMCKDENPMASLHLGRTLVTASIRDKRQRDEIDNLRVGSNTMKDVAKERDEARAEVDALKQKNVALTEECTSKQTAIEKFALEMKKYEALGAPHPAVKTHQFSRLSEREQLPASMVNPEMTSTVSANISSSVQEQRPAFSFTDWVMGQTGHLSGSEALLYREKGAASASLPASIAGLN